MDTIPSPITQCSEKGQETAVPVLFLWFGTMALVVLILVYAVL
jgi:hypothetical protein